MPSSNELSAQTLDISAGVIQSDHSLTLQDIADGQYRTLQSPPTQDTTESVQKMA